MFKRLFIIACALWLAVGFVFGQRTWVRETDKEVREMARPIWISSTGAWGAGGSWSTGSIPVSTDDVLFDGRRSNHSVTSGLDQNAVDLKQLRTLPSYTGSIGVPGSPLIIGVQNLIHQGTGTLRLYDHDSAVQWFVIDSDNLVDAFDWVNGNAATVHLFLKSGGVTIRGAVPDILQLIVDGPNVRLTMESSSDQFWGVWMSAGTVTSARGQQSGFFIVMNGGTWLQEGPTGVAIKNLELNGGVFTDNGKNTSGSIESTVIMGGTLNVIEETYAKDLPVMTIGVGGELIKSDETTFSSAFVDLREEIPILP